MTVFLSLFRLPCSSQAVSHSETLPRDFTFWKDFPPLRTAGLFFPNPVSLIAPDWARDFPGATDLRTGFCKAKFCLFGVCLWLQCHCQKAVAGDHRSEGYWLHEILLAKQEDVVCSGFAAVSRGSNKKKKRWKSLAFSWCWVIFHFQTLSFVTLLLCWCSWWSPGCA